MHSHVEDNKRGKILSHIISCLSSSIETTSTMATGGVPYPCIECKKEVTNRQEALLCNKCELWQHRKCNSGKYKYCMKNINDLFFFLQFAKKETTLSVDISHISIQPSLVLQTAYKPEMQSTQNLWPISSSQLMKSLIKY